MHKYNLIALIHRRLGPLTSLCPWALGLPLSLTLTVQPLFELYCSCASLQCFLSCFLLSGPCICIVRQLNSQTDSSDVTSSLVLSLAPTPESTLDPCHNRAFSCLSLHPFLLLPGLSVWVLHLGISMPYFGWAMGPLASTAFCYIWPLWICALLLRALPCWGHPQLLAPLPLGACCFLT